MMRNTSGQALLLVLLGMSVILIIALSILSSSVTDIKITTNEQDALRAFSAAEAGIEKALVVGGSTSGTIGGSNFNATVTTMGSLGTSYVYPVSLAAGDTATIWLVNHAEDESLLCDATHTCFTGHTIKICWGAPGTSSTSSTTPAMESSVFYTTNPGDYSTLKIGRVAYDPNTSRLASNFFSGSDSGVCTIGGTNFAFQKTIDLTTLGITSAVYNTANGLQMLRIRILYNTDVIQPLGIDTNFAGNSSLPPQSIAIESTGTSGESARKVQVLKNFADLPSVFDSAVFSGSNIVK